MAVGSGIYRKGPILCSGSMGMKVDEGRLLRTGYAALDLKLDGGLRANQIVQISVRVAFIDEKIASLVDRVARELGRLNWRCN